MLKPCPKCGKQPIYTQVQLTDCTELILYACVLCKIVAHGGVNERINRDEWERQHFVPSEQIIWIKEKELSGLAKFVALQENLK